MNRRDAIKSFGALAIAGPVLITLDGCPLSAGQVENEINVLIQEAAGIIAIAEPGVSWLADFSKAAALLKIAEANWIKGGAVQDIINVLNDLQGVCALISPLVPYAALIGVLVAGVDAALALLLPTAPAGSIAPHAAKRNNPFKGMATVKNAKESKDQWNAIIALKPELAKIAIK